MPRASLKPGLTIAAAAALIIGCAGPSVMVEDRTVPGMDRAKSAATRAQAAAGKKLVGSQSLCAESTSSLIHPLHFDVGTRTSLREPCPLLHWEIRTVRDTNQPGTPLPQRRED